ncbi:MAG: hypothetical protein DRN81_01720 [Thermoproteota archaeon]|nr:MAG: hypothetical protein DRN81_01720 [Candidatus Korarchaeota archaeon]
MVELLLSSEGKVKLYIPKADYKRLMSGELMNLPVFYNPQMESNRDLTIAFLKVTSRIIGKVCMLDLLAATGVRGIRAAIEVPVPVVLFNDLNAEACKVIRLNIALNGISGTSAVFNMDASTLPYYLYKLKTRVNYIDIDPFGSPAPFVEPSIKLLSELKRSILGVTATDLTVLFGRYPEKCYRIYGAWSHQVEYSKEVGLRILLGYIARIAASHGLKAEVPIALYHKHYLRAFIILTKSTKDTVKWLIENIGYILHCPKCGWRNIWKPGESLLARCEECGARIIKLGPMWVGRYKDLDIVRRTIINIRTKDKVLLKRLEILSNEDGDVPWFYNLDKVSKKLGIASIRVNKLISSLRVHGYSASRSHISFKSVKTPASMKVVESLAKLV